MAWMLVKENVPRKGMPFALCSTPVEFYGM